VGDPAGLTELMVFFCEQAAGYPRTCGCGGNPISGTEKGKRNGIQAVFLSAIAGTKKLARNARFCEDFRAMRELIQICCEEFRKAAHAIVRMYEIMREIDARTTEILIALLGRPR
jgi:hypothetical protein